MSAYAEGAAVSPLSQRGPARSVAAREAWQPERAQRPLALTSGRWDAAVMLSAALYDVAPATIKGRCRFPRVVLARRDAWWDLHHEHGWGWSELALVTGFDRSTIRTGVAEFARETGLVARKVCGS